MVGNQGIKEIITKKNMSVQRISRIKKERSHKRTRREERSKKKGQKQMRSVKRAKRHSQYHLLLTVGVFGFNLQLLNVLVPDLWSFSGAPALVGCEETRRA